MYTQVHMGEVGGDGMYETGGRRGRDLQRTEEDMGELHQVRCDSGGFIP